MYTLRKRNKVWHYDINLRGKRYRGSTNTTAKESAAQITANIYSQILSTDNGIQKPNVLINEFIELHMRHKEKNLDERYGKAKKQLLLRFEEYLKSKNIEYLQDIDLAVLEDYKAKLLSVRKPKTAKNIITTIATMLNHAVKLEYLERNPCQNIDPIRGITKNKKRFLSLEEIEKVRKITRGTTLEMLVTTALYTGMRRAELMNLRYEDIDLEKKVIYVKQRNDFTTKSKKERVIPLNSTLLNIYRNCTKKGGKCFTISIHWATEYFTSLMVKLSMPDVGLHTLRHTFATHLAISGVPLFHIAQWLGHSTTHITELYAHLCPDNPGKTEIEKLAF